MSEPGADPADPGHLAWHEQNSLPDPDGLLSTFWARLATLTAADVTQILLATRGISRPRLTSSRLAALKLVDQSSLELELDEFRLREALDDLTARESTIIADEDAHKILYGALRDTLLAFAAVQTETSLSRTEYTLLTESWWAGVG